MKKAVIVYHRVDFDGIFSYCLVRKWLEEREDIKEIVALGWTYGDPELDIDSYGADELYMVDISFKADQMKTLKNVSAWIDHHGTALRDAEENGYQGMPGLRRLGTAAVELCWEYFYGNVEAPMLIQILGTYDVWNKERLDWENIVLPVQVGLKARWGMQAQEIYNNFGTILLPDYLEKIIEEGTLIKKYEEQQFKYAVKSYSFPVTVAGRFKGIAILTQNFGSRIFASVLNDYDVYVTANRRIDQATGKAFYAIGLYAEPGRIDFDLGKYVRETYGPKSGGHPGACGISCGEEEFIRLIREGQI